MYSSEITNQFIELRSRDISLERIAQQLGINKSTVIDWQRRHQAQIDEFKAIHLDAVRERLTTRYEDELEYAMSELKRIRAELKTRDWDYEATTFLHHAEAAAYRRVQKLCALADFPKRASDKPQNLTPGASSSPLPAGEGRGKGQTGISASPALNSQPSALKASLGSPGPSVDFESETSLNQTENPSKIQPFPNRNNGGSSSAPLNLDPNFNPTLEGVPEPSDDSPLTNHNSPEEQSLTAGQSEIENSQSEMALVSRCDPSEITNALNPQPPNPAKTLPFPCQNSWVDNPDLSSHGSVDSPDPTQPSTLNSQPSPDPFGLEGESTPINPYESTREWLERHGIKQNESCPPCA